MAPPSGGRGHDLKRGRDVLVKFMPLPCNLAAWPHGRWFWSQCERALIVVLTTILVPVVVCLASALLFCFIPPPPPPFMILYVIIFSDSGFPLCYVRVHSLSVHDLYATSHCFFFTKRGPSPDHTFHVGAKKIIIVLVMYMYITGQ